MIIIKLDFIIEDLSLYGFIMKFGRKPVFIRVNADKACLADSERFIVEYVVGYFGERYQLRLFIFPKTLDRGDRNEGVASDVADLVLNIAFLIAGRRIENTGISVPDSR